MKSSIQIYQRTARISQVFRKIKSGQLVRLITTQLARAQRDTEPFEHRSKSFDICHSQRALVEVGPDPGGAIYESIYLLVSKKLAEAANVISLEHTLEVATRRSI